MMGMDGVRGRRAKRTGERGRAVENLRGGQGVPVPTEDGRGVVGAIHPTFTHLRALQRDTLLASYRSVTRQRACWAVNEL